MMSADNVKFGVAVFSPSLNAVSGVSTHVNMLFASDLSKDFQLLHFQVGSEGRSEGTAQKAIRLAQSPFQLGAFLLRHRPRIVHINTSLDQKAYWRDLLYMLVGKLLLCRVVNQIHGGALPQDFFRGNRLLTWGLRQALRMSDVVTVLSREELEAYRKFDSRMNVHLVPNAIDPVGLADQQRSVRTDGSLRLVYVGRLVRTKGLFDVLESLAILRAEGRIFHLDIAGGGPDEPALRETVIKMGLAECVTFLGGVFGAAKNRLWLESDVFLFPTYHKEGLPYSILEAMAAGCVSLTTRVAAIPDVMTEGIHGLFVSARNPEALARAVAWLDDHRQEMFGMAEAGRARVLEHYTVARLAADFRRIYLGL